MSEGHVVLVGMMGSGKSSVGRRLAAALGRPFVDADDAYESRFGTTIADAFADLGEAGFRKGESEVLDDLLASAAPTVIAAGGGVVVVEANRRRLSGGATVVWLHASPAFLAGRAKAKAHRPLLAGADPGDVFERLFAERAGWYREVADVIVDIEPFHDRGPEPKQSLAERVAVLVRAAEAAGASGGVRA